ncbi:MAG TPA: RDD family protein [Vicinamibacterales bacterium]|nr:RDD family protein [Vicinamibacterales bacterium]
MRCPKCQYISFDRGDRCRNCGYEFSFAVESRELDLPLKTGDEPVGPMSDFSLADVEGLNEHRREPSADLLPEPAAAPRPAPAPITTELPLFRDRRGDDDAPLVSVPAVPRAPVAVRKSSPAVRQPAGRRREEPALDLEPPPPPPARESSVPIPLAPEPTPDTPGTDTAGAGARMLAAFIDLVLLAAIDAGVLYLTLRVSGLGWEELHVIPIMPFLTFLAILNGGYLVAFTAAGGQTIGKMAAGIRVVTADPDAWTDRVPFGQAVLRAVGYVASALPLGLGFLPAFFGEERRAVHDRLAHTRVVKS